MKAKIRKRLKRTSLALVGLAAVYYGTPIAVGYTAYDKLRREAPSLTEGQAKELFDEERENLGLSRHGNVRLEIYKNDELRRADIQGGYCGGTPEGEFVLGFNGSSLNEYDIRRCLFLFSEYPNKLGYILLGNSPRQDIKKLRRAKRVRDRNEARDITDRTIDEILTRAKFNPYDVLRIEPAARTYAVRRAVTRRLFK